MIIAVAAHTEVSSEGTYCNLESMNWSQEHRKLTHRSPKLWKERKADLEELWRQGQNWALEELHQLWHAERGPIASWLSRYVDADLLDA